MRLTDEEVSAIKQVIQKYFGMNAVLTLFGSRVDDMKKGGDIDLLVETDNVSSGNSWDFAAAKFKALSDMQFILGERKIDLVVWQGNKPETDCPLIVREARNTGIRL